MYSLPFLPAYQTQWFGKSAADCVPVLLVKPITTYCCTAGRQTKPLSSNLHPKIGGKQCYKAPSLPTELTLRNKQESERQLKAEQNVIWMAWYRHLPSTQRCVSGLLKWIPAENQNCIKDRQKKKGCIETILYFTLSFCSLKRVLELSFNLVISSFKSKQTEKITRGEHPILLCVLTFPGSNYGCVARVSRNDCSIWEYSPSAFSVAVSCKTTADQVTPEHGTSSSAECILLQWKKAISSQAKEKPTLKQLTFDIWPQNISSEDKTGLFAVCWFFLFFFFFETYLHKSLKIILSLSRVQKLSQNFVIWTRGNKQESFWFWRNGNIHCNQEGIHRDSWNWRCAALPMNLTTRIQQLTGTSPLAMWCVTLNPPAFHTRYWILFYLHSKISSLSLQYVVGTWVSRKPSNTGGGQLCWSLGLSSRSGCHPGGYQNPQVFHRTCCPREMQQFSELHSNLHRNH